MKSYLAAAVQMRSGTDLQDNLAQAADKIGLAAEAGAKLVALPENFAFLGGDDQKLAEADTIARSGQDFLRSMSSRFRITLLGGGLPVPASGGKVYNVALLVGPNGDELTRYQKMHLFDVDLPDTNSYQESKTVVAGSEPPPVHFSEELGGLGLSICYDLRFPELFRHLALNGAEVLLVPAAFTAYTGKAHWQLLLRARAVENTCYVIAPAQTGVHYGTRQSYGHAMIIDPWGVILKDAGKDPGLALARIDPTRLEDVRRQIPSLQHRVLQ